MRSRLLGSVAALTLVAGGVVHAAPPPGDPWTGFYVGGNIGYSWGRSETTTTFNTTGGAFLSSSSDTFDLDGILGGFQLGYNQQIQNWFWGLETDFQFTGQDGSDDAQFSCAIAICQAGNPTFATTPALARPVVVTDFNQKLEWFGTLRGRLGMTVTPTIVAFVTGGLAYGHVKTDGTITGQTGAGATTSASFSHGDTNVGWTIGGGFEGKFAERWTAKIEYLYMDLGSFDTTASLPTNFIPLTVNFSSDITDHILRIGINYYFYP